MTERQERIERIATEVLKGLCASGQNLHHRTDIYPRDAVKAAVEVIKLVDNC